METKDPMLEIIFKGLKLLHTSLFAGCAIFLAIVFYLGKTNPGLESDDPTVRLIFWYISIAMLGMIPLAYYVFRKKVGKVQPASTLVEKCILHRSAYFMKVAILEAACFISTIMFMLTNNQYIFYQTIIILIILVMNFPNKSTIAGDLNLKQEEYDQL